MIIEIIALFCCGTFFGASIYISLAQQPAVIKAEVGIRFFPPMYRRAAPMQITLASIGFLAGMFAWYLSNNILWLIGGIFLISVIPITLIIIKPINDVLLDVNNEIGLKKSQQLLLKWGVRHWIRTVVSMIAFLLYLYAAIA